MTEESEIELHRKRLRYRSWHRGMREMDLIMGRFADTHLAEFGAAELAEYDAILELEDPQLYGWISGREPLPEDHGGPVMNLIMKFKYTS